MSIGVILEVAIGVLFVWVLLALITSQMSEWVSSWLEWRSNMLQDAILKMLSCKELSEEFYEHPLILGLHSIRGKGLYSRNQRKSETRKPSYIPKKLFASVVFDIFIRAGTEDSAIDQTAPIFSKLKDTIHHFRDRNEDEKSHLATALDTLLVDIGKVEDHVEKADSAIGEARKRMESWFDDAMERLSGAYRRRAQFASVVIGISIALAMNADSLAIANSLWTQPIVRDALVAQAELFSLPEEELTEPLQNALEAAIELQELPIPIGWAAENIPNTGMGWFL
ncbi:MAG: hypothetical protein HC806_10275, partial [Anaerolineae bacterium]|nr:hypothetical protein [Anaerolineae bacterium]